MAGYRGGEALFVFLGIRLAFALGCFALFMTPLVGRPSLLSALPAMGIGYVIPGFILARKAKKRQHRIRLSLADALDLMVVSVEAGLGSTRRWRASRRSSSSRIPISRASCGS
jgi:tight adherence protein C